MADPINDDLEWKPGCVDCGNSICRDCDPCADPKAGFWKQRLPFLRPSAGTGSHEEEGG